MPRQLDDWIKGFLKFTSNTEPPYLFRKWIGASVIASALQRKCFLPWGSLTFYPNIYVVLVAPSGKARKGTAMDPGMDFLREPGMNIKLAAEAITREALIRELKNSTDTAIDDESGAKAVHASLTIYSQELTVFLGYNNLHLMSDLTDWYDCRKKWIYRTKHQGTDVIEGVWANLIGATTPKLIQVAMPMDAIGLGLTSRIIFVYEEKKGKSVPDPFQTPEELALRAKLVSDLEKIAMSAGPFRVTEGFVSAWTEWYLSQEGNPPFQDERFAGYFERRPAHVMKLSMILNASRSDKKVIDDGDLSSAIEMLEATEVKMPMTFSGIGASSQAAILARVMAEVGNRKEVTFAELMNILRHDATKWDLERVIDALEAMDFCTYISNTEKIVYNENFKEVS